MPASIAFFTGVVKAVSEMTGIMIPSALAEIAEFMKVIISLMLELADPPQFGAGRPSSAAASAYPYLVGVKNAFVSAWLTNQNFQAGVFGKFPATFVADARCVRSEERRVGKEGLSRQRTHHAKQEQ